MNRIVQHHELNTDDMEFNPANNVISLCVQGMDLEEKGRPDEAGRTFLRAWNEATNDFEKFIAAFYVARHQDNNHDSLKWMETSLEFATKINDLTVKSAYPSLYMNMAKYYAALNDTENSKKYHALAASASNDPADKGPFYHGTRADLATGDLLLPGGTSNYDTTLTMNHIYFTALPNGAGLAAALARGNGHERVYIIEPTGPYENDPNVTDKKFPGNPTRSYRSASPLKIVGEITDWAKLTPDQIQKWREKLANNKGEIIN